MRYRIDRRKALGLIGGAAAAALVPVPRGRVHAQTLDKVSFQTNWRSQAEHGGFYQAATNGIYTRYGLEVEIRMGGPQQNVSQMLMAGRVDLIMSNGFEAINYVKENLPFVCVAAILQKEPQAILSHPGVGNDTLPDLKGKPIYIATGSRTSWWPFLKVRFGFTDEQARPYTFNMAPFLADRNASQQGFVSSEPLVLSKAGVTPVVHLLADYGYENYQTTIHVARKMADEKRDLVQRFVSASLEGWAEYLNGGPATDAANAVIKRDNPEMDDEKIGYAVRIMNERGLVRSGDALKLGIGAMADERWKRFYDAMAGVGVFPAGLDIRRAYTLDFVNKGIGA